MTRRRLSVALVVVVLLVSGVAWAQPPKPAVATPPVKALPTAPAKPVAPPRAKSPCPDGAFQQACDSYAELVKAKDDDVSHITTMSTLDIHLVCFRGTEDSFFVLNMTSIGWNKRHFDPSTKTIVGDDDATQPLVDGHVKSFVKGIQVLLPGDKPVLFGYWRHPHNPVFESKFDGQ